MIWLLQKISYRIQQAVMGFVKAFLPWRTPALLKGPGSLRQLPDLIRKKGRKRALVVTDPTLSRGGFAAPLLRVLAEANFPCSLFDGAEPNPTVENAEAARALYIKEECDCIIAFGGGSSIDCAKAAAVRIARPKRTLRQLKGQLRVLRRLPLLFAVPTTAGSGSETTMTAVITDRSAKEKFLINDFALIPRYAVLDPELTVSLPPSVTASTGMDALTHATEAYCNLFAPAKTRRIAFESVHLIFRFLETACKEPSNLDARGALQLASFGAGAAFTRATVGYVHAIAHTLGGLYNTPHGLANAVILPHVLARYGAAVTRRLARLSGAAGIQTGSDSEKAAAFIQKIRDMNAALGIPQRFDFIEEGDVAVMARRAAKEANPLYPVPVLWSKADLESLIRSIRA